MEGRKIYSDDSSKIIKDLRELAYDSFNINLTDKLNYTVILMKYRDNDNCICYHEKLDQIIILGESLALIFISLEKYSYSKESEIFTGETIGKFTLNNKNVTSNNKTCHYSCNISYNTTLNEITIS